MVVLLDGGHHLQLLPGSLQLAFVLLGDDLELGSLFFDGHGGCPL